MKHGKGWLKGLAAVLATALLSVLAFSAPAAAEIRPLNNVSIDFSKAFEAGNLIPYDGRVTGSDGNWVTVDSVGIEDEYKAYAQNGVVWMDITDPDYTRYILPSDGERFVKGHRYRVMISVRPGRSSDDVRCFSTATLLRINGNNGYWLPTDIHDDDLGVWRYTANYRVLIDGGVITQFTLPPIPQPAAGEKPYFDQFSEYYDYYSGIHISYYRSDLNVNAFHGAEAWYDENTSKYLSDWDTFQAGHTYCYRVVVSANEGWCFNSTGEVRVRTSDGQEATGTAKLSQTYNNGYKDLIVDFRMPVTIKIPEIRVTGITEPAVGAKPDYTVSESAAEYRIWNYTSDDGIWKNGVKWYDLTATENMISGVSVFEEGHRYQCIVLVRTENDTYEFLNDGTLPTAKGSFDGKSATVYGAGSDVRHYVRLYRNYTLSYTIAQIEVEGITEPVVGAKPDYTVSESAAEYGIWDYTSDDGTWKNGVKWYDLSATENMIPGVSVFEEGHRYQCAVLVRTENDMYEFLNDGTLPTAEGSFDGKSATVYGVESDVRHYVGLYRNYTLSYTIAQIEVEGITEPAVGAHPDYSAEENSDAYHIRTYTGDNWRNGVKWRDRTTDMDMSETFVFEAGHTYQCIVLVTMDNKTAEFANDGTAVTAAGTINGRTAKVYTPDGDFRYDAGVYRNYELTQRLPGDADADGKVDMKDALTVVRYLKGESGSLSLENADVNGDSAVDILDARLIGQYAAGWDAVLK